MLQLVSELEDDAKAAAEHLRGLADELGAFDVDAIHVAFLKDDNWHTWGFLAADDLMGLLALLTVVQARLAADIAGIGSEDE